MDQIPMVTLVTGSRPEPSTTKSQSASTINSKHRHSSVPSFAPAGHARRMSGDRELDARDPAGNADRRERSWWTTCRLFNGEPCPRNKTKETSETEYEVAGVCETMRKVIMIPRVQDRTKNRGFALFEFRVHRSQLLRRTGSSMREKWQLWAKRSR
ncbi:hypothetical protein BV898_19041 [Hypsibius exemplaris]|uniref:Uncharacterized protein n=1 Tax=Hypsibius exemplaris TaxID=2072580 RepID=A0A9X6NIC2_HYPEX|nr:hypothetical protein BV898_19041 [Hypsibius exemplaris]